MVGSKQAVSIEDKRSAVSHMISVLLQSFVLIDDYSANQCDSEPVPILPRGRVAYVTSETRRRSIEIEQKCDRSQIVRSYRK